MEDIQGDMKIMSEIAAEAQVSQSFTQDSLTSSSEELAKLYHHVCMINGETPNRVMLDHMKSPKQVNKNNSGTFIIVIFTMPTFFLSC